MSSFVFLLQLLDTHQMRTLHAAWWVFRFIQVKCHFEEKDNFLDSLKAQAMLIS
jgi:hypothetical protein